MKLLCVTSGFLPQIGRMQISTHQTLLALSEAGLDLTLVAASYVSDEIFDKQSPYRILRKNKDSYAGANNLGEAFT